eukprot:GHVP01047280.1.p1 GENE.GHVP01047280.1~~GHVP01047280.1.p1  ORF type:complete len:159 (-),score=37.14 GHVP01047280.1:342-818(-)
MKISLCEKKLLEESLSDTQRQILVEEKKNDYIAWSIRDKLEEMWDEFDSEFREVMKLQEDKEPLIEGFVVGRIMSLFADEEPNHEQRDFIANLCNCTLSIVQKYKADEIMMKISLFEKKLLEENLSDTERQILDEEKENYIMACVLRKDWEKFVLDFS